MMTDSGFLSNGEVTDAISEALAPLGVPVVADAVSDCRTFHDLRCLHPQQACRCKCHEDPRA